MKKGQKKKLGLILLTLLLIAVLGVGMVMVMRRRPVRGIEIHPTAEWESPNPVYYRQNDPKWGGEKMGEAVDTLAGSGCLITCLAASMEMQVSVGDSAYRMTPEILNREFSENQVYDEYANVLWNPLKEYLPEWTVSIPSKPDGDVIEEMLQTGQYPIVKVRMPASGASHWVLLLGAKEGEYYCMDPLSKEEMVPLSKFGDMVYSVRSISR